MESRKTRIMSVQFNALLLIVLAICSLPAQAQENGEKIDLSVGEAFTIHSEVLGESRQVLVSLPRGYEENNDRFPVLIVLDGSPTTLLLASASLYDRTLPDFVIAAVPNVDRIRDMSHRAIPEIWPTSGGADRFLDFLTGELIQFLDTRFRTTSYRVIHGGSATGRFAVFAMLERPDIFDAALARSPALGTDFELLSGLVKQLGNAESPGEHFLHIVYGSHDYPVVTIFVDRFLALLEDTAPSWLKYSSQVVDGKGHYQHAGLNIGLSALFQNHEFPTERFLTEGPEAVAKHIEQLNGKSGWPVDPNTIKGERAIVDAACDLGRQRRFSDAIRVFDYGIEQYPKSAALTYYRAQIYEHSGNVARAKSEYQTVFKLEPNSGLAGMTRIFLDNMAAQSDRDAKTRGIENEP